MSAHELAATREVSRAPTTLSAMVVDLATRAAAPVSPVALGAVSITTIAGLAHGVADLAERYAYDMLKRAAELRSVADAATGRDGALR